MICSLKWQTKYAHYWHYYFIPYVTEKVEMASNICLFVLLLGEKGAVREDPLTIWDSNIQKEIKVIFKIMIYKVRLPKKQTTKWNHKIVLLLLVQFRWHAQNFKNIFLYKISSNKMLLLGTTSKVDYESHSPAFRKPGYRDTMWVATWSAKQ